MVSLLWKSFRISNGESGLSARAAVYTCILGEGLADLLTCP